MPTSAHQIACNKAAECKLQVNAHRQTFARANPGAGQCVPAGWDLCTETLNGDFDVDTPVGQALLRSLLRERPALIPTLQTWQPPIAVARPAAPPPAAPRPGLRPEDDLPPWLRDYLFGQWGGAGTWSEIRSAGVGPGNVIGNGLAAAQAANYIGAQGQTASRLSAAAQQISLGAARTIRINQVMDLYNANQGKGAPRLRLRVRNLPVTAAAAIPAADWRTNSRGNTHSTRWAKPTPGQVAGAGVVAAESRWAQRMAWATGRMGTGVITFAPTAALDAWSSIEFDLDASGQRHVRSFDTKKFLITSARNQSGNALGLAASIAAVPAAVAVGVGIGVTFAGAPLVLIALGVGLAVQVVWNVSGGADFAENQARAALGVPR